MKFEKLKSVARTGLSLGFFKNHPPLTFQIHYYSDHVDDNGPLDLHFWIGENKVLRENHTKEYQKWWDNEKLLGGVIKMYSACDKLKPYLKNDVEKTGAYDGKTNVSKSKAEEN